MNIKRIYKILILIVASSFILGSASCAGSSNELTAHEEETIYAAVIRQVATIDDTFGGNLNPSTVYLIRRTDDGADVSQGQETPPMIISESSQLEITSLLSDLSADIIWIDKRQDAEFEDTASSEVKDHGVIITIGNISQQKDGTVQVVGSIYIANLAAGGTTYILEKIAGVWEITGTTGVSWIS